MQIGSHRAPEPIGIAMTEEADRLWRICLLDIDTFQDAHIEVIIEIIDKGTDEFTLLKEMQALWWYVDTVDMAAVETIGSQEFDDQDRHIHQRQHRARNHGKTVVPQAQPDHLPL